MQEISIENDPAFQNFIEKVTRRSHEKSNTPRLYASGVRRFCRTMNVTPTQVLDLANSDRNKVLDLLDNFVKGTRRELSDESINTYIGVMRAFLAMNHVAFGKGEFKYAVILPEPTPRTQDVTPTQDQLGSCFNVTDIRGKTLLSTMISSGMRVGEATGFLVEDIHYGEKLNWIQLPKDVVKGKKHPRRVPISPQAADLLEQLIATRSIEEKGRVFPVTIQDAWYVLINIFLDAGILIKDQWGRNLIHSHCTRKFFFTECGNARVNEDVRTRWMGHRRYLDDSYFRENEKMIIDEYEKVLPRLIIGETAVDLTEVKNLRRRLLEDNKYENAIAALQKQVEYLVKLFNVKLDNV